MANVREKILSMATMATGTNFEDLSGATMETIRNLVNQAERKLEDLQERRATLRKRIQALRLLGKAFAGPGERAPEAADRHTRTMEPTEAENPRAERKAPNSLRRACRIALMESEQPQSDAQILERIRNRQSAAFAGSDPLNAVVSELDKMVSEGESQLVGSGVLRRWQLKR